MNDNDQPTRRQNRQGGVPLGDEQHRAAPDIARGDRAAEAIVSPTDEDPVGRVQYSQPVDGLVAPQMVNDHGEATPDSSQGDLAQVPARASVWEATEDGPAVRQAGAEPPGAVKARARQGDYAPEPLGKNDIEGG